MPDTLKFTGQIGRSVAETTFAYEEVQPKYGKDAPNVLYIVLDDLGFSDLGCYGSEIRTPNIDSLAQDGLRFNNFHTTAICSATRASLLTGTNHHEVGVGALVDQKTGVPNGIGHISNNYATIAEILQYYDYRTYATGKWHLSQAMYQGADISQWPLQRGFDRYYGFLSACQDQFHPTLVQDNTFIQPPNKEGYHLSEDITDHAINYIYTSKMEHPDIPVFLYLPYGAMHSPHHVSLEYADRYKGVYDKGWDEIRAARFKKQKELGVIPQDAELTERNELVKAWDELSDDAKKVFARQMEVYAGFLEHTDEQIGRVLDFLKSIDQYDNTLIVFISDNGASAEGGQSGRLMQLAHSSYIMDYDGVDEEIAFELKNYDLIGTEKSYSHYPIGWANVGNTPFKWYKQWTYEGGTKDPLIIRYPALINDPGAVRGQYVHVSDITPTVLDVIGVTKPDHIKGIVQKPMTGTSFKYALEDGKAADRKHTQYYEMMGNRSIYHDGWKAIVNHGFNDSYDQDVWELYHVEEDYSENNNVADKYPEKLESLKELWLIEAGKNHVFPMPNVLGLTHKLDDHMAFVTQKEYPEENVDFKNVIYPYNVEKTFRIKRNSFSVTADVEIDLGDEGVLFNYGDRYTGFSLYVKDGKARAVFVRGDYNDIEIESAIPLQKGKNEIKLVAIHDKVKGTKTASILVNGISSEHKEFVFDAKWFPKIYLGYNPYNPMGDYYDIPFAFTGKINLINVRTAPSKIELEEELEAFFNED